MHVEDDSTLTRPRPSDARFSATLLKLGGDDDVVDPTHHSGPGHDTQLGVRSAGTYGGRHVVVSACTYVLASSPRVFT